MHRIHPVCEETISPHVGRPVCLVMNDGRHMYGTLGGCRDGKVYLNECFQGPRLSSVQSKQQLRKIGTKELTSAKKAKSSAYGRYPYGGGYGYGYGAGYDVALIATLFLLPFLFI
ncbi:MAG: hypothetical protein IKE29_10470 [Paenibacillus sp.]|uniref:hypothetical protein n=1 Tax=Paenibacillus sp. TaxID=58172 RepID=UPI0025F94CDF|nr:hypothetical protein [Paenibacillus sp.]MBR2565034.1 hypothetical protein [Paenibacillus sp.]